MKKLILTILAFGALAAAAPAQAADLPVKAMPMKAPVAVLYSWNGVYAGVNAGYSWGRSDTDVNFATFPGGVPIVPPAGSVTSGTFDIDGAIAGIQGGYNWQNGQWVLGIEGDVQWSGQKGSADFSCAAAGINTSGPCFPGATFLLAGVTGNSLSLEQKLRWFATLRGRIGVTLTPTWLLYATGGLAIADIKTDATLTGHTIAVPSVAVVTTSSSNSTKAGWTIGAGLEGVISGRWTGKIEYLYIDYGDVSGNVAVAATGIQANWSSHITDNVLRVGLNYHY